MALQGKKLLYVEWPYESQILIQRVLALFASENGLTVVFSHTKEEVRNYLRVGSYDLIIIRIEQWNMPDGFRTIHDALDLRTEKELDILATPILLILSQRLSDSEQEMLKENNCSYLYLPVDLDYLLNLIPTLLT